MTEKIMTEKIMPRKSGIGRIFKKETAFLIFIGLMIALPFVINLITGSGLNDGITKFWQGQLITFFIMAVFAMSYDLLIGYGGILSFGHAASFGVGAYAVALLLKHWAPGFIGSVRITIGVARLVSCFNFRNDFTCWFRFPPFSWCLIQRIIEQVDTAMNKGDLKPLYQTIIIFQPFFCELNHIFLFGWQKEF